MNTSQDTAGFDVHLDVFEGPLDLLLFLIKKEDLDIYNIPIARITHEYLSYIELMKELSLDVAGEFLVLASTLMAIKARMLVPSKSEESQEEPDPRAELVAKLLEYQKFKEASSFLERRMEEFSGIHYRGAPHFDDSEKTLGIGPFALLDALKRVLDGADLPAREVEGETCPIEPRMERILSLLDAKDCVSLDEAFAGETRRRGIIAVFLAMLELLKLQKISIRQEEHLGPVLIFKKEVEVDAAV